MLFLHFTKQLMTTLWLTWEIPVSSLLLQPKPFGASRAVESTTFPESEGENNCFSGEFLEITPPCGYKYRKSVSVCPLKVHIIALLLLIDTKWNAAPYRKFWYSPLYRKSYLTATVWAKLIKRKIIISSLINCHKLTLSVINVSSSGLICAFYSGRLLKIWSYLSHSGTFRFWGSKHRRKSR